jgi:putative nucleotidyltransferase with HDIG domain
MALKYPSLRSGARGMTMKPAEPQTLAILRLSFPTWRRFNISKISVLVSQGAQVPECAVIKKINVERLKPGIFVHDFNSGWLHHPFLRNKITIETDADVEKVLEYQIREVYIDTERGLDIDDAQTQQEVAAEIQTEIDKVPAPVKKEGRVPLQEELVRAKRLISAAKKTTRRLMDDVKLGKQIDVQQVETVVDKLTESVLNNKDALISLVRIKQKDEYTYMHSLAVSALCISFAQHLGLDAAKTKQIGIGGLLHDFGKVKIPLEILTKPGPLTEMEFEIMKKHVEHGECILRQTTRIDESSIHVTAHHHERLDGTGYPEGLRGDQISLFGQMAAIVDIYDALTAERCYKNSLPPTEALKKLFEWSDGYLNREMVEQFIAHVGIYPVGTLVRLRSGLVGVVVDHGGKGLLYPIVRVLFDTRRARLFRPFSLDLSKKALSGESDEVVSCESPARFGINPDSYLI